MQQRHLLFSTLTILVLALFSGQQTKAQADEQTNKNSPMFTASMRNMKAMNNYLEKGNKDIIESMMRVGKTKVHYLPLAHTASDIQKLSTEFNSHISRLKDLIGEASNGLHFIDAELWKNRIAMPKDGSNKTGVEKVLLTEEKGAELYKKQNKLSSDYLQLIKNLWSNDGIYSTIFGDPFRKDIRLKKFSDKLLFITANSTLSQEEWIKENFQDKTIEEVFITLTNLQNQVNLSTNSIINSLSEQIGRLNIYYDRFGISAQSETLSVILGDSYEATISLETYSTQVPISFSVDDQKLEEKHGKGLYKVTPTELGEQTYRAKIWIVNPLTGENETFSKTFKYKVVAPK
jgi:hypothetical protein